MRLYRPLSLKHPAIRRRLMYRRNARAPKGYTVAGTKVKILVGGSSYDGVIQKQIFGGVGAMFLVKLAKPIPFRDYAEMLGKHENAADPLFKEMLRLGCLKEKVSGEGLYFGNAIVTCAYGRWQDVSIRRDSLKKGQPIELVDQRSRDHAVRFVKALGVDKPIIVWFPEPMTFMDIEDLIDLAAVHPSHISKDAYFMPFEGYKKLYKAGIKMPPARRKRYGKAGLMEFTEPIPLKRMADLLRQYHRIVAKGEPDLPVKSIWFTLMKTVLFHMGAIRYDSVSVIRPMREDLFYGLIVPAEIALEGL